jgi:hypothetical protein
MRVLVLLAACEGGTPEPGEPPRVLEGPLLGAAVAALPGEVWMSAPGIDGDGGVYGFVAPSGSLTRAGAAVAITAGSPRAVGASFASCDLEADGTADLVIGAPEANGEGGAWLVHGPLASSVLGDQPFLPGDDEGDAAGAVVACGRTDGSGDEVAMASPHVDRTVQVFDSGKIALYDAALDRVAVFQATFSDSELGFRSSLLLGRDLDGDGVGDLVAGAWGADRVHVMLGPFAGTHEAADSGPTLTGSAGEGTGYALATGDFDGDGALDLAMGIPLAVARTGGVWVQSGPFDSSQDGLIGNRAHRLEGVQLGDEAGFALATVPDADDDGDDELLVGAPFAGGVGPEAGAAYLVIDPGGLTTLDGADTLLLGEVARGRLGWALASDDIDLDGVPDLVVAAPESDVAGTIGAGAVHVFPSLVRGVVYPDAATVRFDAD